MEIEPINIVGDEVLLGNNDAMKIYLSHLYAQMPFEDFKWSPDNQFFHDEGGPQMGCTDEVAKSGDSTGNLDLTSEGNGNRSTNGPYWTRAFQLLRDANHLIAALPKYKANYTEALYNHYLGEGYFVRAFTHYALAKRYGGIPLITEELLYPEKSMEELDIARSTEEESWNQVLADFDKAIELLGETAPMRGLSNKYAAAGFKAQAMLYAGCVAKYDETATFVANNVFGEKTKVRVCTFDPATAAEASKKYFLEAWKAARFVMKSGKYSLAGADLTDPAAQAANLYNLFFNVGSSEAIYAKEYKYLFDSHSYDCSNLDAQWNTSEGARGMARPTLDFVELFDGFPKNAWGQVDVFANLGSNGEVTEATRYKLFDNLTDLFADAEPRLKAYVLLPGEVFDGKANSTYAGVYMSDPLPDGIPPVRRYAGALAYGYYDNQIMNDWDLYKDGTLKISMKFDARLEIDAPGGIDFMTGEPATKVFASGINGPWIDNSGRFGRTGFLVRKWLQTGTANMQRGMSDQPFIILRYAEILLSAAEAAVELNLAGVSSPDGENGMQIAYDAIQAIRRRAGATALTTTEWSAGNTARDVVRKERRKELAFEWKTIWDIRRWRVQHSELIAGRSRQDGNAQRELYPYYSAKAGKWFFDAGLTSRWSTSYFTPGNYYLPLPGGEVSKSSKIDQQPWK
jgi:hypothetical protein